MSERASRSELELRFVTLQDPDAAEVAAGAPPVVAEGAALPEPEGAEGEEPDADPEAPVMKLAIGGPGKVYGASGVKTLGSKIPGSLSLYAPGMLTRSLAAGTPVWLPPTVICAQAG